VLVLPSVWHMCRGLPKKVMLQSHVCPKQTTLVLADMAGLPLAPLTHSMACIDWPEQMVKDELTGALVMVGTGSHAAVYLARLHGRLAAVKVGCTGTAGTAGSTWWLAAVGAGPPMPEPRGLGLQLGHLRCCGLDDSCCCHQPAAAGV
jgi:hypothetical protein